jgi:hypothetical protein
MFVNRHHVTEKHIGPFFDAEAVQGEFFANYFNLEAGTDVVPKRL